MPEHVGYMTTGTFFEGLWVASLESRPELGQLGFQVGKFAEHSPTGVYPPNFDRMIN